MSHPKSPTFVGSKEEFVKFIGGYCRNKVLNLTRAEKKKLGVCQTPSCRKRTTLEAAHIHGRERITIINEILDNYINSDNLVEINLNDFERLFVEEHTPISKSIIVLCKDCHRAYDNKKDIIEDESESEEQNDPQSIKTLECENKIGVKVRDFFKSIENKEISNTLVKNLCDADYSKNTFNIIYPVLLDSKFSPDTIDNKKIRYYSDRIKLNNKSYYLCNHWFEYHIDNFSKWTQSVKDCIK